MKARILLAHMVAGLALLAPLGAAAQPDAPPWKFSLMPYLWVPSVDGKLNFGPPPTGGGSANINIDTSTLLDNLDFAFMINGEARKGRWLVATDVIYLDFGHVDSSVRSVTFDLGPRGRIDVGAGENSGTQSKLKGWLWTAVGGYAAIQDPRANLDVIGGFRYLSLDATTSWQLSANVTVTDPVSGATTRPSSARAARASPIPCGQASWAQKAGRSSARATGSSTTTPTSAAGRTSLPGRARRASGTRSGGAMCSSTTGTCITARAARTS